MSLIQEKLEWVKTDLDAWQQVIVSTDYTDRNSEGGDARVICCRLFWPFGVYRWQNKSNMPSRGLSMIHTKKFLRVALVNIGITSIL
jgi:hypothetical protein